MFDSTYIRYLEEANSHRHKYDRGYWGLGEGDNEELLFNGYRVSIWDDEIDHDGKFHKIMNVLNATELYA